MSKPTLKEVADDLAAHLTNDADGTSDVAVAVLDSVAAATAGYADPAAELKQMAEGLREGGLRLAASDPAIVTTEVFDRAATLLDSLANALS